MSTSHHAPGFLDATAVLDRLDTQRVANLVQDAVSEIPIGDLVSSASNTVGVITDHIAGFTANRQRSRSRRVAIIVSIVAVAAVTAGVVVARRRRSADAPVPDDQRRPGAANPN